MAGCHYEYEPDHPKELEFACNEPTLPNGNFCFFHDNDRYAEHEQEATERFEAKVRWSISQKKALECVGYYLPAINFPKLLGGKSFAQPVYFTDATFFEEADFGEATFSEEAHFEGATFSGTTNFDTATFSEGAYFAGATFSKGAYFDEATFTGRADFFEATFPELANFRIAKFTEGEANFSEATFTGRADFSTATFSKRANFEVATFTGEAKFYQTKFTGEADFSNATFSERADFFYAKFLAEVYFIRNKFTDRTFFRYTIFEQPNKVIFDDNDLSKVSFADSDITKVRFGDKITWGIGKKGFTIVEEKWLENKTRKTKDVKEEPERDVSLELVLSVYRNLRENYEFRLKYDDAGKFFIREMELKRKYREIKRENDTETKENGRFRRYFSLTGLYYHLSRYGESIARPTLIGAVTLVLSTLFWVTQSNPILEPHFDPSLETTSTSTFVGSREMVNATQWLKAFERSFADFLPLLSLGGEIKVGIIDYVIKIVGGALTFGLLIIAFRRKFERKYTR